MYVLRSIICKKNCFQSVRNILHVVNVDKPAVTVVVVGIDLQKFNYYLILLQIKKYIFVNNIGIKIKYLIISN